MHENQTETGKFARFFEEKGFYIILFLCVMAIGIAGYVLYLDPSLQEEDTLAANEEPAESAAALPEREETQAEADPLPIWEQTDRKPSDVPAESDLPAETVTPLTEPVEADPDEVIREAVETIAAERPREEPEAPKQETPPAEEKPTDTAPTFFVRPVSGAVLREFSGDELVYDRTMGDWRTHNGVDFQASDGALVAVVADGVVEDVYHDAYYGTGVLVNHGGGLMSVYLGLIENATVTKGQAVTAGDTIGAVCVSTLFESLEPAHLHMEMTLNGQRVDPMEYLPA